MAKAKSTEDKEAAKAPEPGTTRTGVDILPADLAILERPIDERMAALKADHIKSGARQPD
jgi:hypothetical protein